MAEKDGKAKEEKKKVAKKEPEVSPKKQTAKKKVPEKKVQEKKAAVAKEEKAVISEGIEPKVENGPVSVNVVENTSTSIESNDGAVDTAPKSVKTKKKKSGLVIFMTILVFLLIAALGFFAVLYYTDSDLLKKDISSSSEKKSSKKESDKLVAIDANKFEDVFEGLGWQVTDLSMFINKSEETALEKVIALESGNTSSASYASFENEKDSKQFYEDSIEQIEDTFEGVFNKVNKNKTSGSNWDKYTVETGDKNTIGYAVIVRVDKTVLAISTETDVNQVKKAMKKLGYE